MFVSNEDKIPDDVQLVQPRQAQQDSIQDCG